MDSSRGNYLLILHAAKSFSAEIGKLGTMQGEAGYYYYCGSAFGPGGIAARVKHHGKISARPHWHMDYLRPYTRLSSAGYATTQTNLEHDWAQAIATFPEAKIALPGFGASDCRCRAHLIWLPKMPSMHRLQTLLLQQTGSTLNIERRSS